MASRSYLPRASVLAGFVALGLLASTGAQAAGPLVRFEDGIGSQPLRAGGTPNVVFGHNPGGVPWVISRLSADISTDARVKIDGRGLLLGGGNAIGGIPPGLTVKGILFCAGVEHQTEVVPVDERGDFRIEGFLNPFPPAVCNSPVLLITNPGGSWFAAGIPKR
jgi:hypothetical protein